ncbi:MAG: ABC transporter permease subunit [Balneolales bacterium]
MMILKILKYQLRDAMRSKWIILHTLFFFLITDSLFRFTGEGDQVITSMMNVVLLVIPLFSIVLGVMYLYNSREYIELLLCQPVKRDHLFWGLYGGISIPMVLSFTLGVIIPFIMHNGLAWQPLQLAIMLIVTGVLLTVVFVAIACFLALTFEDKITGLGIALAICLFFTVIYDGLILLFIYGLADYPLQQPVIIISMLNPIDLGRIILLLNIDVSALMGFTGAVFQRFFGSALGQLTSISAMLMWVAIPCWLGRRAFLKKDF